MKVSIITVCFNSQKHIHQTIESILHQSYKDYEYIIIDGGSTDGTIELIEEYMPKFNGKLKYISEPDEGIYDAMNKGLELAAGELIGIINSDDWYEGNAIENIVCAYNENLKAGIFHGKVNIVDKNDQFISEMTLLKNVYEHQYKDFMPICHPATFVKKSVYNEIGMFDTNFKIAADYDFALRCIKGKKEFKFINSVITNYRQGGISNQSVYKTFYDTTRVNIKNGCNLPNAYLIFLNKLVKYFISYKFGNKRWYVIIKRYYKKFL